MKRFLSIAIILMMVLSLVQLPAMAATEGTDYIIVDDNTVRILTQGGWTQQFSTYNVVGKTIYLDGDIEIGATGATLNCNLIGKEGGVDVTLKTLPMFSAIAANVTVSNLNLKPYENTEYTFASSYQGILVKEIKAKNVTVSGITNYISCVNTGGNSMGIIGATNSGTTITISDCVNYGDFSAGGSTSFAGGILGGTRNASDVITIENCVNYGNMSASTGCGGIYSGPYANSTVTITGCVNEGTISTGANASVGGIVGLTRGNATITDCVNKGSVSGTKFIGGIAGGYVTAGSGDISISGSVNTGLVSGTDRHIGGILGAHNGNATIIKCANTGNVTGGEESLLVGGIAGAFKGKIDQCYNTGSVTAKNNVAGIIGNRNSEDLSNIEVEITNCYNTGAIHGINAATGGVAYVVGYTDNKSALTQKISSVYNAGAVTTGTEEQCYAVARQVSKGVNGSAVVEYVYSAAGEEYVMNDIDIFNNGEIETSVDVGILADATQAGFERLPEGFDSEIWVACEGNYPILKNNLPKNADGTDKEYYVVTLTNGANGEALKATETYVEKGKTYTLALDPEDGYEVESVTADGVACEGINNVYEIVISDDAEVSVVYALIPVEEGTTSASQLFTTVDAETFEVYAFASFGVVTGNDAVDFGMLLSFEETDDFTLNNTSLRKFSANLGEGTKGANEKGQYGIKLYGNLITNDKTYYCVPYVEYADGTVCYGSVMTVNE